MQRYTLLLAALVVLNWAGPPAFGQAPTQQLQSATWAGVLKGGVGHADCKIQTTDGVTAKIFIDASGLVARGGYTLWTDAGGNLMPILKDIEPMGADRKGSLKKSTLLNSCPADREVHVILRQELGAGRFGGSLEGVLKKQ